MIRMHPRAAQHGLPEREPTVDTTLTAPASDQAWVNSRDPARALGPDGRSRAQSQGPVWADVPDEQWDDWRWQLSTG